MTVRESLGRLFRRNTLPPIDPAMPPPFAAICWLAPIVILALPMLLAIIFAMIAGWGRGSSGSVGLGENLVTGIAIGFWPLLGLPIAWAGMFAFGYPVLKLLWRRGIYSYIVHALAGAAAGAATMMIVTLVFAWIDGKAPADVYTAFGVFAFFAAFGAGMGAVTALLGRWAMTWRWLQN